jgi:hypothetical protein
MRRKRLDAARPPHRRHPGSRVDRQQAAANPGDQGDRRPLPERHVGLLAARPIFIATIATAIAVRTALLQGAGGARYAFSGRRRRVQRASVRARIRSRGVAAGDVRRIFLPHDFMRGIAA